MTILSTTKYTMVSKKKGGGELAATNAAKKAVATYKKGTYKKKPADLILEAIKGVK